MFLLEPVGFEGMKGSPFSKPYEIARCVLLLAICNPEQGARVWLPDSDAEWIGAEIIRSSETELVLKTFAGDEVSSARVRAPLFLV